MSRGQVIKAFCRRRKGWWLAAGLLLVFFTLRFFWSWYHVGPVKLEFVGFERRPMDHEGGVQGTSVTFRLSNHSGRDITYRGLAEANPVCGAKPLVPDDHKVEGGTLFYAPGGNTNLWWPWPKYCVLKSGEERIVYADISQAEQSWVLEMKHWEGRDIDSMPRFIPTLLLQLGGYRDLKNLPGTSLQSEPVHRVIPSWRNYINSSDQWYFMTEHRTNQYGRVTAKMKSVDRMRQ